MKLLISRIYATILAILYEANIKYYHINRKGYWEFEIYYYSNYFKVSVFKTKGLR